MDRVCTAANPRIYACQNLRASSKCSLVPWKTRNKTICYLVEESTQEEEKEKKSEINFPVREITWSLLLDYVKKT